MMDDVHDLAAFYALDALTPDETQEFENHLAGCVECQEEVSDMRSVTEQLSRSVQAEPPASLRSSVLTEISLTTQEPWATREAPLTPGPTASAEAVPDNVVALRPRWSSRVPYLVAAAALLVAVAFGGWGLQNSHDAQQASNRQAELVSLFGASDVRTVSGSVPGGGSGTVVLSRARGEAVFVSSGMPALADNKVYELWTVTGKPSPAGTFSPGAGGTVVNLPSTALSADRVAVTIEPAGGSAHPTSPAVMTLDVPQPA